MQVATILATIIKSDLAYLTVPLIDQLTTNVTHEYETSEYQLLLKWLEAKNNTTQLV